MDRVLIATFVALGVGLTSVIAGFLYAYFQDRKQKRKQTETNYALNRKVDNKGKIIK